MKFYATAKSLDLLSSDTLIVCVGRGTKNEIVYPDDVTVLDRKLHGRIRTYIEMERFEPTLGSTFVIQTKGLISYDRVVVVGCGDMDYMTAHDFQLALASGVVRAKKSSSKTCVIAISELLLTRLSPHLCLLLATEAAVFGTYEFLTYKKKKDTHEIASMTFCLPNVASLRTGITGIASGAARAEGTVLARDLVNEPSSMMTPSILAKEAKIIAAASPKIRCTVFEKKDIANMKMQAFLAVAKGSDETPKFIKLEYRGGGKKTICLAGKGITYDSGGLSLKPQSGLETMKCDMAGAAAILGVFATLAKTKPTINVVGLIAACENMPSGHATKPGDVVRAMNGKTVEIINTDAEGRLILADTLSYAQKFVKSDYTVDVATLTGACMVALGEDIAGVFSNDDGLVHSVLAAAQVSGEKFWQLPIPREYEEQLKSPIADIANVSKTRFGGAINGALFLKEFIGDKTKWAHLDIAGPAFAEKETALNRYGGTGFAVRTLLSFLEQQLQ